MLISGHVPSRPPASGTVARAATTAGHEICPPTAATFPAEVAMVFVSAIGPRADGAASLRRRGHLVGAPTALSHDLARIVVVAEPPGPGSEDTGRRTAGRSWGGALRCFGAGGQGGSDQLGCAPVPDSQPGTACCCLGADAVVASVRAGGHHRRRPAHRRLRRGQKPERPAGSRRGRSGRRRMGAGERGEGHRRPPPALPGDGWCGAAPAACARHEFSLQPHRCRPSGSGRARAVPGPAAGRSGDRLRLAGLVPGLPRGALSPGHPGRELVSGWQWEA